MIVIYKMKLLAIVQCKAGKVMIKDSYSAI